MLQSSVSWLQSHSATDTLPMPLWDSDGLYHRNALWLNWINVCVKWFLIDLTDKVSCLHTFIINHMMLVVSFFWPNAIFIISSRWCWLYSEFNTNRPNIEILHSMSKHKASLISKANPKDNNIKWHICKMRWLIFFFLKWLQKQNLIHRFWFQLCALLVRAVRTWHPQVRANTAPFRILHSSF